MQQTKDIPLLQVISFCEIAFWFSVLCSTAVIFLFCELNTIEALQAIELPVFLQVPLEHGRGPEQCLIFKSWT